MEKNRLADEHTLRADCLIEVGKISGGTMNITKNMIVDDTRVRREHTKEPLIDPGREKK